MLITYERLRDVIYHNSRSWSLRSWLFKALDDSSILLHLWVDYGLQLLGGDDVLVGTWTKAQLLPSTVTLQPNRPATQVTGSMISGFLDVLSRHSTMLHNAPQVKLWLSKFFEVDSVEELPGTLRRPETSKQEMAWAAWVQRSATSKHTQRHTHVDAFHHISRHFDTDMMGSWWVAVIPADDALEVVFVQPVSNCPLEKSQQFCRHLPLSSTIYSYTILYYTTLHYTIRMVSLGKAQGKAQWSPKSPICLGINCDKGCLACLRAGLPLQNAQRPSETRI